MKRARRVGRATTDFFEYAGGVATLLGRVALGSSARLRIRVAETI